MITEDKSLCDIESVISRMYFLTQRSAEVSAKGRRGFGAGDWLILRLEEVILLLSEGERTIKSFSLFSFPQLLWQLPNFNGVVETAAD